MEDDLMRIFGSDRMKSIMDRLGVPEDMPIENSLISKSIESAQKKVEGHNFDIRKHLVEYDDIINKHREVIYKKRRDILSIAEKHHTTTLRKQILELVEKEIEQIVLFHTSTEDGHVWDLDEIYNVIDTVFPVSLENRIRLEDMREKAGDRLHDAESRTAIINYLTRLSELTYDALEKKIQDENIMRQVEKAVYIRAMDTLWIEHLDLIDHLRQGIGLRGYGQQDPLVEYKKEAYRLFNELINNIQKNIVYTIFKINPTATIKEPSLHVRPQHFTAPTKNGDQISSINETDAPPTKKIPDVITQSVGQTKQTIAGNLVDTQGEKIGRNNPCPCGSGKKYKQCHGK
jgi:preprotein translocase subunit SecA